MQKKTFRMFGVAFLTLLLLPFLFGCDGNALETTEHVPGTDLSSPTETDPVVTDTEGENTEELFFSQSDPLSEYVLVYGDDCGRSAAEFLAEAVETVLGVLLPVVCDAEAETEREILVGMTSRTEFSELGPFEYLVKTDGKKLLIGGRTEYAVQNGAEAFVRDYVNGSVYGGLMLLPKTYEKIEYCYVSKNASELSAEADVRIMSWNLLNESATYPVDSRAVCAAATISYYKPDVIGTQETSAGWYRELDRLLDGEYAYVTSVDEDGEENYSTLWYRTETVRVIDFGVMNYEDAAVKKMRIVTWGVFEVIQSGERFIVTSTHWDREVESPGGINITKQAAQLAELLSELREKYSIPAFCTGDYNRIPATKQYKDFLEKTNFNDAPKIAEFVKREAPTYHEVGSDDLKVGLIDHIFCSPESRVLLYNTVLDPAAIDASDHCPIYIDVNLSDAVSSAS